METISINNINKTYNKVNALNNVSFSVLAGELFGLIGPDGAGKTSLFRILTTLLTQDSGTAKVCGFDTVRHYKDIRKIVGYMPGKFSLYQDLSIEENLNFFAKVFDTSIEENYDMIRDIYVQIEPFKKRKAGKLSGGMKQKLALCCALVHKPQILFLDEPTTGVDPVSRKEFWAMLTKLKTQGITVLVSTPYMDEAVLCDKIALIQQGNIMSINTPNEISLSYNKPLYAIKCSKNFHLLNSIREVPNTSCYMFGENLHLTYEGDIHELESTLKPQYPNIVIKPITAGIEDCFINLMQQ